MATPKKNNGSKSKRNASSSRAKDSVATTAVPQNGEHQKMVSEAAYYRAMSRNFEGDPVEDWLEAEREITTKLSAV